MTITMFMEVELGASLEIIKDVVADVAGDIEIEGGSFEGIF